MTWLEDSPSGEGVGAAIERHDASAIRAAFDHNRAGAVQCYVSARTKRDGRSFRQYEFQPFDGNGTLNVCAAVALAQGFVIECGGHYEINGERFDPDGERIELLVRIDQLRASTESGTDEEQLAQFDRERRAWHESTDAQITHECCPKCEKPMPAYRKSCRYCGYVRGRL